MERRERTRKVRLRHGTDIFCLGGAQLGALCGRRRAQARLKLLLSPLLFLLAALRREGPFLALALALGQYVINVAALLELAHHFALLRVTLRGLTLLLFAHLLRAKHALLALRVVQLSLAQRVLLMLLLLLSNR